MQTVYCSLLVYEKDTGSYAITGKSVSVQENI